MDTENILDPRHMNTKYLVEFASIIEIRFIFLEFVYVCDTIQE